MSISTGSRRARVWIGCLLAVGVVATGGMWLVKQRSGPCSTGSVSVARDALGVDTNWETLQHGHDQGDLRITVLADDPPAAAAVLDRLAFKFMEVAENGQLLTEAEMDKGELYTPNFVFDTKVFDKGAFVQLDTKGVVYAEMGRTDIRMTVEALKAAGVCGELVRYREQFGDDATPYRTS